MTGEGYTVIDGDDNSTPITNIDPGVKLLVLVLPTTSLAWNEINAIKSFSAEGGRVLFVGEYDSYYGTGGLSTENNFLSNMGAVMRNIAGSVDCGYTVIPGANIHDHQITHGLTNITVACLSRLQLGRRADGRGQGRPDAVAARQPGAVGPVGAAQHRAGRARSERAFVGNGPGDAAEADGRRRRIAAVRRWDVSACVHHTGEGRAPAARPSPHSGTRHLAIHVRRRASRFAPLVGPADAETC
jgi:hypothetical protein